MLTTIRMPWPYECLIEACEPGSSKSSSPSSTYAEVSAFEELMNTRSVKMVRRAYKMTAKDSRLRVEPFCFTSPASESASRCRASAVSSLGVVAGCVALRAA